MDFEYWWLLAFPLFFGLGWLAARIDLKQLLSESRRLPASYFKGLNFLLNEQTDQAIEAFIEAVRADSEMIELHFSLGALFRRRGEVDRAIRMHQSLLDRDDLGEDKKLTALFELGQDYLKAGLYDRAEEIFGELDKTRYANSSRESLLVIYAMEKEWEKAIDVARQLETLSHRPYHVEISHFYCEMAVREFAHSDNAAAQAHLQAALLANRDCVRANLLLGDHEAATGRHEEAIALWKRIETQNSTYLPLLAERLLSSFRALDRLGEGVDLLSSYLTRYGSLDLLNTVFQGVLANHGTEAAYQLVRDELHRNPTLLGLERLLELQLLEAPAERRHDLQMARNLVHQHSVGLSMYRCGQCGFKARQYFWQCPACGGWESFAPRRGEEDASNRKN
ncbi:MAG: lipopolysaccharide assembly protein LapB [Sulfuricella sp.]|nr:lipopolysaccharide assembly protein LapB [Sulfuricella sp.]